jgi:hypothetical protein
MGVLSDTFDEFKKASPQEKIFIVGGGLAAIAIALYIHSQNTSAATNPNQAATGASLTGGTSGGGGGIQTVPGPNSSQVPILPSGLVPLYDGLGNLIGYQPAPTPAPAPAPAPGPKPNYKPGISLGPTGVYHYQPSTSMTFGQIASMFGLAGWNSIYAIPQNQKTFGALSAKQLQTYKIQAGSDVVLPQNAQIIKQGGGPYGTRVLGTHQSRIAPTQERKTNVQPSEVTRIYALRNR